MKPWHGIVLGAVLVPLLFIVVVHFIDESGDSAGSHPIAIHSVAPSADSAPRQVIPREPDLIPKNAIVTASSSKALESTGGGQVLNQEEVQSLPTITSTEIPLSFTEILADMHLSEDASNGVRLVAEQFVKQVGPPPIWLGDPGYAERWQKARSEADDALKGVLGWDLFNKVSEAMIKGFSSIEPDQLRTNRP
jgi:hypothetical protein